MARQPDPLTVALAAATRGGRIALAAFGRRMKVESKADASPVTDSDRRAEEAIRGAIRRAFPEDGFLGEEFGDEGTGARARWIIDPIDGTRNFIRGIPFWGVLLAREVRGHLTTGVMHFPALRETLWATRGRGAYRNGRRLRVSRVTSLARAYVSHGGYEYLRRRRGQAMLAAVYARCAAMRAFGDCWGYSWVARGHVDAMFEADVKPWDAAALKIVVREAGGRFTDWRGRDSFLGPTILASNGRIHGALVAILRRFA